MFRRDSGSPLSRRRPFLSSFLIAALTSFGLTRLDAIQGIARRNVSPRGGNRILFLLMKWLLGSFYMAFGPLQVKGARNVPRAGGVIIAPNHTSDCDVTALYVALPRWAWFVAKEELFKIPILGKMMAYYHAFPIRRSGPADRSAMKQILDLVGSGEAVVIFPEGKLTEDGYLQEFQQGTAMLALKAGVPVIPAAMNGTRNVVPYGRLYPIPSFRRVKVRFGPPVDFSGLPEVDRHERLRIATERIRQGVVDLVREIAPETLRETARVE
ncbi:MAG TPA: lysophospholipid acyltransferase family protein [Armatimonadota bacterium]|nr:lysophospholipid acyltransferase family protein [Armatimonadota bacterium]